MVIQRPTIHDLSSSVDDFEQHIEKHSDLLAMLPDAKESQIGVYFVEDELLSRISAS